MDWDKIKNVDNTQYITIVTITVVYYIFGGFGNIISIVIFNNKTFKKQPETVYLISACVMNLIAILYTPVMFLAPIWIINNFNCIFYTGLFTLIIEIQAWITAMGSFDRMISTLWPHKYSFKKKFIFQLSAMELVVFFIFIVNMPELFYFKEVTVGNISTCSFPIEPEIWITIYFKIQYILVRAVIPFFIMLISSFLITYKIFKMKYRFFRNSHRQREKQLLVSLIALDIFFIAFRLPMLVYLYTSDTGLSINRFAYSIYLAIGLISNVFIFVILIIINKVYRNLFLQLITNVLRRSVNSDR